MHECMSSSVQLFMALSSVAGQPPCSINSIEFPELSFLIGPFNLVSILYIFNLSLYFSCNY